MDSKFIAGKCPISRRHSMKSLWRSILWIWYYLIALLAKTKETHGSSSFTSYGTSTPGWPKNGLLEDAIRVSIVPDLRLTRLMNAFPAHKRNSFRFGRGREPIQFLSWCCLLSPTTSRTCYNPWIWIRFIDFKSETMILSFAKLSSAYSQIARTYVSLSSTALSIFAVACWFSQLNSTLTTQDPRGFCYLYVEPAYSVIYYLGSYFMKAS